jgi:hypothetical protein
VFNGSDQLLSRIDFINWENFADGIDRDVSSFRAIVRLENGRNGFVARVMR